MRRIDKILNSLIPGGAHTYSRGFDQFSYNAPGILKKGKGCYVFDNSNKKYLDYGIQRLARPSKTCYTISRRYGN